MKRLLVILLLGATNVFGAELVLPKAQSPSKISRIPRCLDGDLGIKPEVSAAVNFQLGDPLCLESDGHSTRECSLQMRIENDTCLNAQILIEHYCEGDIHLTQQINCRSSGRVCKSGQCVVP